MPPVRLVHTEWDLEDVVEALGRDRTLVAQDFALVTVAARLSVAYGSALCFKGGFVLRHVYGHARFSKDIDSTRIQPPKHKLDAQEIAAEIGRASMPNLLHLTARGPRPDNKFSLDFDDVAFDAPIGHGKIAVEI